MFTKTMALAMISMLASGQFRPGGNEEPDIPEEVIESPVDPPIKPPKWDDDWHKDYEGETVHWDDEEFLECEAGVCEDEEEWEEWELEWQEELKDEKLDPEKKQGKCYGIALADATDFGPYQAGALIGLLKHQ